MNITQNRAEKNNGELHDAEMSVSSVASNLGHEMNKGVRELGSAVMNASSDIAKNIEQSGASFKGREDGTTDEPIPSGTWNIYPRGRAPKRGILPGQIRDNCEWSIIAAEASSESLGVKPWRQARTISVCIRIRFIRSQIWNKCY